MHRMCVRIHAVCRVALYRASYMMYVCVQHALFTIDGAISVDRVMPRLLLGLMSCLHDWPATDYASVALSLGGCKHPCSPGLCT